MEGVKTRRHKYEQVSRSKEKAIRDNVQCKSLM